MHSNQVQVTLKCDLQRHAANLNGLALVQGGPGFPLLLDVPAN